jgi:hypothetical protein
MTVLDLIKASLRTLGVLAAGETPSNEEATDCRQALNLLLQGMQNEGLLSLTEQQTFDVAQSTISYTVGSGQTWDGNKPLRILSAILRYDSTDDYPLEIVPESEYLDISLKNTEGRPRVLMYVPGETTGTVYLYPKPDHAYEAILLSQKAFTEYTAGGTTISLPNGYLAYLKYALAIEIAPEFEREPSAWVLKQEQRYKEIIQRTNLKRPRQMQFDPLLTGYGKYDIQSDTYQ